MRARAFFCSTVFSLATVFPAGDARADNLEIPSAGHGPAREAPLAGAWTLVSVDNILPDGTRIQPYGPNPEGLLLLDQSGRYAIQIYRPDRPRFASNDKSRATAEENQMAVRGSNCHFGRYEVDMEGRTLRFGIEHASFPNWEGTEQRRSFVLNGDELTYTVRTTTTGGAEVGEVTWKRLE